MIAALADPGTLAAGRTVALAPEEAHHLKVRRARDGETIALLDGEGVIAQGRYRPDRERATVEIESVQRFDPPPALILGVGAGDRDRFGWLVEKAAELGVTSIVPLETERATGVGPRLRGPQLHRLRARARDALKQCLVPWAAAIAEPVSLGCFLDGSGAGIRWVADREGSPPPPSAGASPVTVAIGPEGGFTDLERELLGRASFERVSFGPHVLRFETAAIAAAAAVTTARQRGAHD